MRSDPLLEELEAPLLLSDPEQLLGAPLIGGESHNLSDEVPHKLVVFGHLSLGLGRLSLKTNKKYESRTFHNLHFLP